MSSESLLSVRGIALDGKTATILLGISLVSWVLFHSYATNGEFQSIDKSWLSKILQGQIFTTFIIEKNVQRGYTEVHKPTQRPFTMSWWSREYILMPPKYLIDFKRADSQDLSFFKNLSDAFSLHSSVGNLYGTDIMVDAVRKHLNTHLPQLIPLLSDECTYAFETDIKVQDEWKEFNAAQLFGKIMHRVTSRVLMGRELCRNEEYLSSSMSFSDSIMINAVGLTILPLGLFRNPLSWVISVFHRYKLEKALKPVVPVVKERMEEAEADGGAKSHLDSIAWTLELSKPFPEQNTPRQIALQLLHNLWAGSAAPGGLVTQMLFLVLMYPEYQGPLRAEMKSTIEEFNWSDKALNSMPLLDSFIRETNRLYPTGSITCARTVMNRPFEFHDKLILPTGSRIAVPCLAVHTDPENFQNPLEFDGFRFSKMRSASIRDGESEQSWAASTISTTNLAFGYGKHACPGRFYAVRKVKLIFSRLLLNYDIEWASPRSGMPTRLSMNGQFAPNQEQMIRIKRRKALLGTN